MVFERDVLKRWEKIKQRPDAGPERCIRNFSRSMCHPMKPRQKWPPWKGWLKKWTENQWQQVLWSNESFPEPGAQHY